MLRRAHKRPAPFVAVACDAEISLMATDGGENKLPKFSMTAYTGGPMQVANYYYPVVVDLSSAVADSTVAILKDHDPQRVVGHASGADVLITPQRIKATGVVSGTGSDAMEVVANARNSYPWQASIGGNPKTVKFLDKGEKVVINGRTVEGPKYILGGVVVREISVVSLGADSNTSTNVAASFCVEVTKMDFNEWLAAKKIDEASLTAEVKAILQASYEAEQKAADKTITDINPGDGFGKVKAKAKTSDELADEMIQQANQRFAANAERIDKIQAACKDHPDICAKAIKGNWTPEKAELEVLRAERGTAPSVATGSKLSSRVLEAALCVHAKLDDVEKVFKPEELEAAHKEFKGRLGLQEVICRAAEANGWHGRSFKSDSVECLRAAFSTVSLPGILSNTANKFLLAGYRSVEDSWRMISSTRTVNDFKAVTSYRLSGNANFEKVGPGGELKHGTLGEQSYTNQAETYGKMYAITRTMLINDDLDSLSQIPRLIGRGSALKFNEVFWTEFMDNSSFFASTHTTTGDTGNSNYSSGGSTALGINSLTAAELLFLNQVDNNGNPLGVQPMYLLVPNALSTTSISLTRDLEIRDTTASTKYTTANPHAGKWTPIRSSYLSNSSITGYSTTAWYLLASPQDVPVIEAAFLNGNQNPIIESADADFNTLGIQMRGYFDFGVQKQDFRGGVKFAGA